MIADPYATASEADARAEFGMSEELMRSLAQLSRKWTSAAVKGKGITLTAHELGLFNAVGLGHILLSAVSAVSVAAAEQQRQAVERLGLRSRTNPTVPPKATPPLEAAKTALAPVERCRNSLLRISEVRHRTGLSVATIYRRVEAKTFPPKVRLGPNSVAWYNGDIDAFVADPAGYRSG
jgi:prophage regulatory protein